MDLLKNEALSYLSDNRLYHTLYCEQAAILLAKHYKSNIYKCKIAALFHDITKKLTLEEQILLCKKYNIQYSKNIILSKNWKLIHGHTAAEIAKKKYNVDDDIYYAIKWHTTGHYKMNNIGKILYIADSIDESKKSNSLTQIRYNIYNKNLSLDEAMIQCLNLSINELINKNIKINLNTILVRNILIKE